MRLAGALLPGTLLLSFSVGLAFKVTVEQRRRRLLIKYIQESDAQAPFVSGELKRAVGAP